MRTSVVLDGQSLTLDDVVAVALGAPVELAPAARARMERANDVVLGARGSGNAVAYGVTTGFGKLSDVAIPRDRLDELQVNLVRSHAAGVGPLLPEREARAMMLLRANVIAKGYSGARPDARGPAGRRCSTPGSIRRSRSRGAWARAATSRRWRISRSR